MRRNDDLRAHGHRLKPDTFDQLAEVFGLPETAESARWVRFHRLRGIVDENEVITFHLFDGTAEQLGASQDELGYGEVRAAIEPLAEDVMANALDEIVTALFAAGEAVVWLGADRLGAPVGSRAASGEPALEGGFQREAYSEVDKGITATTVDCDRLLSLEVVLRIWEPEGAGEFVCGVQRIVGLGAVADREQQLAVVVQVADD